MFKFIEEKLTQFRSCFSRKSTFNWFVVIVISLMTRTDSMGVTSFIRALSLNPPCYESMLHFFRSTAVNISSMKQKWWKLILQSAPCIKQCGMGSLIIPGPHRNIQSFLLDVSWI